MASSADRMAAGAGFGALAKADELKKRLWFTVGALIIYRLGTYLPLPGIDPGALADRKVVCALARTRLTDALSATLGYPVT